MRIYIYLLCLMLSSCSFWQKHSRPEPPVTPSRVEKEDKAHVLPKELYLENRMSCDSAIAYMDHVISPGELPYPDAKTYFQITVTPYIPFENWKNLGLPRFTNCRSHYGVSAHRFYLAPKCFINHSAQKVYDVFVKPEYHNRLIEIEQEAGKNGYVLFMRDFGFSFSIRDRKVIGVNYLVCDRN